MAQMRPKRLLELREGDERVVVRVVEPLLLVLVFCHPRREAAHIGRARFQQESQLLPRQSAEVTEIAKRFQELKAEGESAFHRVKPPAHVSSADMRKPLEFAELLQSVPQSAESLKRSPDAVKTLLGHINHTKSDFSKYSQSRAGMLDFLYLAYARERMSK